VAPKKIGLIIGQEKSWFSAFIEEVEKNGKGVTAELVKLGGTRMDEPCDYDVIIDRMSHHVPYYRAFLKTALLQGTIVINNPFWSSAIDSFFGATLASRLGISHLRTVALPSHSYSNYVHHDALGNLIYPIPWDNHIDHLGGFPVILRPAWNTPSGQVYKLESYEDLWRAYNETGTECMMLQEHPRSEKYVRCICIGSQTFLIKYDPYTNDYRYPEGNSLLTKKEQEKVSQSALKINEVLGYDVSTIDFTLTSKTIFLTDIISPSPDFDEDILPATAFDWVVKTMAEFTVALAQRERRPLDEFRWEKLSSPTWGKPDEDTKKPATTRRRTTSKKTEPASAEAPPTEEKTSSGKASSSRSSSSGKASSSRSSSSGKASSSASSATTSSTEPSAEEASPPAPKKTTSRTRKKTTE